MQVALESTDQNIPSDIPKAISEQCNSELIVCEGDTISGKKLSSLSSITNRINQLLKESNQENLIQNFANSIDLFDKTQGNLDELLALSKEEIIRLKPAIKDIKVAAAHLNKILETINNEETLEDIKATVSATNSISQKVNEMTDDFQLLIKDKELTRALRDLAIGLSKFLNEVYP